MRLKKLHGNVVTFIVGPTAIGKTRLSVKLARRIDGEIISCDSMQIYRGVKTLSQAPAREERKKVKHYLVGILDPRSEYSVAFFITKAAGIINSVIKRKARPIIVGGSGLYIKALVDGLFPSPPADLKFRKNMEDFVSTYGSKKLYRRLSKIDPASAAKIHPNDARRIIRALELYNTTGNTMTELKRHTKGIKDRYRIKIFGLTNSRAKVYANINSKVDWMFENGVVDEVKKLARKNLSKTARAILGYKEINGYLNGRYDLDTAKELMKKNTRHFAKRQLTWFRQNDRIKWFDVSKVSEEAIINRIIREVE